MDIKQEDFDKLKQLDRIEYRQKEDKINSQHDGSFGGVFLKFNIFMMVFGIFIILMLLVGGAEIELIKDAVLFFAYGIMFLALCMILGGIIDFILLLITIKNINELQERYFKIEVKK